MKVHKINTTRLTGGADLQFRKQDFPQCRARMPDYSFRYFGNRKFPKYQTPTPDWRGFCNLLQKDRRTEPLAGPGKLDAREGTGSFKKNAI